jgi:ABC-2 type transport system ATP-binding protein
MHSIEPRAARTPPDLPAAHPDVDPSPDLGTAAVPAISIRSVVKRYGRFEALRGVSLDIAQGEFFGLLGPNGAGKTSLISIIAGLSRPDGGSVRVMGRDVDTDFRDARRLLGVVPQELVFDPFFTVRETLRLTSGYYGVRDNDQWIDEVLEHLDLTDKANANMRALSGGMKRRVLVAQALVHRPPVIVLDEPTAGVDVELRRTLWAFIRRLNRDGHTIVLTTHYLEEAQELCGRIAMLKAGQIVALARTSELLGRFSGGQLSVRLSGAPLPPELESLRLEGGGPDRLVLRIDTPAALEATLRELREAGCRIDEIDFERTDLEDVFLRIIREAA